MVATRSSTKRKSITSSSPARPAASPPASPSIQKRQKLPLRKKKATAKPVAEESPEATDEPEKAAGSDDHEEEDMASSEIDLDAALQAQVAAANPDTPVAKPRGGARKVAAPAREVADSDEEEESDDEGPEAVSNVTEATRAREAAEAMKKSAKEYVLLTLTPTHPVLIRFSGEKENYVC